VAVGIIGFPDEENSNFYLLLLASIAPVYNTEYWVYFFVSMQLVATSLYLLNDRPSPKHSLPDMLYYTLTNN
jgi:hypothetical protein